MVAKAGGMARVLEKMMKTLLTLLALLPLPALASGFDAPWWFGASLWLLGTPGGWATIVLVVVVVAFIIYEVARK